jgi:hypothetical protein
MLGFSSPSKLKTSCTNLKEDNAMKKTLTLGCALLVLVSLTLAQNKDKKPNYSGAWKFSAEKSGLQEMTIPSHIVKFTHKEPQLETQATMDGKATPVTTFEIGGKGIIGQSECCGEGTTKYFWEGQALVMEFKWENGVQKDVYTLSANGKILTDVRTINQFQEKERTLKFVYEKQ